MSIKNKSDELIKKIYGHLKDIDKLDNEEYDMFVYFQNLKGKNSDYDTLNHNIFTEFYKLISMPQFINNIDDYLDKNKSDNTKYSEAISNLTKIFKHILEKNSNVLKKNDKSQVKKILDALHYNNVNSNEIIFLLYILYLDGCLYQYNNLHDLIELTYNSSFYKSETDSTMKLNSSIIEWLNNRNKLNNYMYHKSNRVNIYYKNSGTYELNDELKNIISYFIITDIYSKNDIQKILDLIDNTDLNESNKNLIKKLIKDNYIEVNFDESNKSSPLYYLCQVFHTYDQIQYELVVCRIKQLINLKNQIYDQTKLGDDSVEFLNSTRNMIYTLKQYFKYPLTFHIKITNKYSIFKMLSTDQNKIILEKYHKLKIVLEYLKNNKIDIKNKKKFDFKIEDLSMRSSELPIDSLVNNHELLYDIYSLTEHIKNNINYFSAINDILSLSNIAKDTLIKILNECSKSPFNDINSINNIYSIANFIKNGYSYEIPLELKNFIECCAKHFDKIILEEIKLLPVKPYIFPLDYDSLFPEIEKINDEIDRYKLLIGNANGELNSMLNYVNYIIENTKQINKKISDIRSIIDLTDGLPYTSGNTFKNENKSDIKKSNDNNIDYDRLEVKNTKMNELFKINSDLGMLLNDYSYYTNKYKNSFDNFKSYYGQIQTLNDSILKKKLQFNKRLNNPNGMKDKYEQFKVNIQAKIDTINLNISNIDSKISNLEADNSIIDPQIAVLNANPSKTPAEYTQLTDLKIKKKANNDNIAIRNLAKQTLIVKLDEENKKLKYNNSVLKCIDNINIIDYNVSATMTNNHLNNELNTYIKICLTTYDTYHNDNLINNSVDHSFIKTLKNQTIVFKSIKDFIVVFNRKQRDNLPNNLLLHRIKKNMFEVINLSYQQYNTYTYFYEFNKMCSSFELITNELFKNVLKRKLYYGNMYFYNIDDDADTLYMLSTKDIINDSPNQKLNNYETKYNSDLFKLWSNNADNLFSELCYSESGINNTYSLFQIIDYLNNNFNQNMIEKIYMYLEILGEVKPFNINSYVNMVRIDRNINIVNDNSSGSDTYKIQYNLVPYNPTKIYNYDYLKDKNNSLQLFRCEFKIDDILDDDCDVLICSNNMFNNIYVNYENLIKELNSIDTNLLIKELFKIRRDNNIKLMSDFHRFESKQIEFNDNYVYNYCTERQDIGSIKTSFFYPILNNGINLQQFENSINKLAVLVLELINGV